MADADRYAKHLSAYERSYNSADERERELVQASAEVIALDARTHASMLRLHTYLAYERPFKNLHTE